MVYCISACALSPSLQVSVIDGEQVPDDHLEIISSQAISSRTRTVETITVGVPAVSLIVCLFDNFLLIIPSVLFNVKSFYIFLHKSLLPSSHLLVQGFSNLLHYSGFNYNLFSIIMYLSLFINCVQLSFESSVLK